jgi:RNA polymerase sigma-70 factor (ECF subfamily)
LTIVLLKKFLNKTGLGTVFMSEGRHVVAGEAILSGAAPIERTDNDRTDNERTYNESHQDEMLEALVREHSRLVYRVAYAVLRRHHDAEDATQETFMRVLRYSSKLAAVENQKTWLARIAWRVAIDRGRQRGRTREIPLEGPENPIAEAASSDAPADVGVHGAQVGAALERMIAALPDKLREPLILSALQEMSPTEVGVTLGINEAAVRSRVFRARQILREKLARQIGRT